MPQRPLRVPSRGQAADDDAEEAKPSAARTHADRKHAGQSWRDSPWLMLFVLTLVGTVNWADRQVVSILFPGIRADLGLSDTELGVIGGVAFSLIYALSAFVFGRAADHLIHHDDPPLDHYLNALAAKGAAQKTLDYYRRIYGCIQGGRAAAVSPDVLSMTGHSPRGFSAFVEENRAAWRR